MALSHRKFISHVRSEIEKAGGILRLSDSKYIMIGNLRVNGYFGGGEYGKLEIAIATQKPIHIWLGTLSHEFAHFQQMKAKCRSWTNCDLPNGEDAIDTLDGWISGNDIHLNRVNHCIKICRNLELDCERRSLKNIIKYGLPIEPDVYCQRANAYVHFYNYIRIRRRWYKIGQEPYQVKEIISAMPKHLNGKYHYLPKRYLELYDEFC